MPPPQAKVNNASLIGVGYTQSLRPGKATPLPSEQKLYSCSCILLLWKYFYSAELVIKSFTVFPNLIDCSVHSPLVSEDLESRDDTRHLFQNAKTI